MTPPKTRRVLVCRICGHESEPLGTSHSVDQEAGDRAHKEMNSHIAEKHHNDPEVQETIEAAEPTPFPLLEFYTLEIRRNAAP